MLHAASELLLHFLRGQSLHLAQSVCKPAISDRLTKKSLLAGGHASPSAAPPRPALLSEETGTLWLQTEVWWAACVNFHVVELHYMPIDALLQTDFEFTSVLPSTGNNQQKRA